MFAAAERIVEVFVNMIDSKIARIAGGAVLILIIAIQGITSSLEEHWVVYQKVGATAQSYLVEDKSYGPELVLDGRKDTAWSEGVSGYGIGQWIKLYTLDGSAQSIRGLHILNGYHKSTELFVRNGKADTILLEFSDGSSEVFAISYDDYLEFTPRKASWVRVTILSAKEGTEFEDTCITEIEWLQDKTKRLF